MERLIQLSHIFQAESDALRNSIYVSMPGAVVSYDAAHMLADVQPMLDDPRQDVDTGAVKYEPWPIIKAVPICWPRFGGYVLAGPLVQNDPVILMAWDLDPSAWLDQGASTKSVQPHDVRRLSGNYWRAIPFNIFGPISDAAAAAAGMLIGKDDDPAQLLIAAGAVTLGKTGATASIAGGANALATAPWASGLASALATLASSLASATTVSNVAAAGTALQTALGALPPAATTATKAT